MSPNSNPYAPQDPILRRSLPGQGKKVLVALSGGRDSGLAAALLKEQGYEVQGLFFDFFGPNDKAPTPTPHCHRARIEGARSMARSLGITLHEANLESPYATYVLQRAVEDALQGHVSAACTPCQGQIRLDALIRKADELEIGLVATGHFARLSEEPSLGTCLWQAKDLERDQSSLLSQLKTSWLKRLLLPLGHLKADEVKRLATEHKLPTDETASNTTVAGQCYATGQGVWALVEKRMGMSGSQRGYFITRDKQILGEHKGVHEYTVGQRHGLEVPQATAASVGIEGGHQLCVVEIDPWKHWVVLGPAGNLAKSACLTTSTQWLVPPDFRKKRRLKAQLGHDANRIFEVDAELLIDNQVRLSAPKGAEEFRPRPGESCAFFDGYLCLGGAEILETYFDGAR